MSKRESCRTTRREFIQGLGTLPAILPAVKTVGDEGSADMPPVGQGRPLRAVTLNVNGACYNLEIEPRRTLADVIRKEMGLTGTKIACDHASCGACTVLMDGRAIFACHLLAIQAHGKLVLTIESLASGDSLHPIQEAFIEHDGSQCGFCTPGMIMAIKGAIDRNPTATREQIGQEISGNLCRCGAYNHILDAAVAAAQRMKGR